MPSPPFAPGSPVTPSAPSPVEGPGGSECVVCMETGVRKPLINAIKNKINTYIYIHIKSIGQTKLIYWLLYFPWLCHGLGVVLNNELHVKAIRDTSQYGINMGTHDSLRTSVLQKFETTWLVFKSVARTLLVNGSWSSASPTISFLDRCLIHNFEQQVSLKIQWIQHFLYSCKFYSVQFSAKMLT